MSGNKGDKKMLKNTNMWMLQVGLYVLLTITPTGALAQTHTVTYELDNVWLLPDITRPWEPARQMTGIFEWTYQQGDFENGSGQFIELDIPWYNPSLTDLNFNVDLTSIEITLPGNFHDLGVDISLFLMDPLSPDQPSVIDPDRSSFEIQNGVIFKGHVVSGGGIIATATVLAGDLDGDGFVGIADLNVVLGAWNQSAPPADVAADPSGSKTSTPCWATGTRGYRPAKLRQASPSQRRGCVWDWWRWDHWPALAGSVDREYSGAPLARHLGMYILYLYRHDDNGLQHQYR